MKLTAVALLIAAVLSAAPQYPGKSWKQGRPSGWSQAKLQEARQFADTLKTAAVVIVQNGTVVDQWGDVGKKYMCHSVRKSLLSGLYGIYVQEGKIRLDATLAELGIDDNEPRLTDEEKKATVADLLKARSGIYHPALYETASMRAVKPPRGSMTPGTHWTYNNWDFNALGTIFEKLTGEKIFESFHARIAQPIGMEDYTPADGEYFRGEDSIHPAYPFKMSARDLARFGYLFLRKGNWNGKQIIPAAWVAESTASYSEPGYGYMWWVDDNWYSARGAGGHYVAVVPELDMVVVHRVDTFDRRNSVSNSDFQSLLRKIADAAGKPELIREPKPASPPQCLKPGPGCTERLYSGDRYVSVFRNLSPQVGTHPDVTRAIVMIHGAGRNAGDYYGTLMASAVASGNLASAVLVAPHFKANETGGCADRGEPGETLWPCNGWKDGALATNARAANAVYSFDYVDLLIGLFNNRQRFPALREIVIAGHSAGGQFVHRYAAMNLAEPKSRLPVRYVVANPSTYLYLDDRRIRSSASCSPEGKCTSSFVTYGDAENCTGFNRFKYGLSYLSGYATKSGVEAITAQLPKRRVTYMVGDLDRQRDPSLDKTCPAMAQGPNRYERGVNYWNYIREYFGATHDLVIAPGCGHSATCVYAGTQGQKALFGDIAR